MVEVASEYRFTSVTKRLQTIIRDYCQFERFERPIAVTLTTKARFVAKGGEVTFNNRDFCQSNLTYFLERLSHELFGNTAKRNKARFRERGSPRQFLRVVPFLEQNQTGRYHHHLLMDCPAEIDPDVFKFLVGICWGKTHWGDQHIHIEDGFCDSGWLRYITKVRSKEDFDLAVDWANFCIEPTPVRVKPKLRCACPEAPSLVLPQALKFITQRREHTQT